LFPGGKFLEFFQVIFPIGKKRAKFLISFSQVGTKMEFKSGKIFLMGKENSLLTGIFSEFQIEGFTEKCPARHPYPCPI